MGTYISGGKSRHDVPVESITPGQREKFAQLEKAGTIHQANFQQFLQVVPKGFAGFTEIVKVFEQPHPRCIEHWLMTQLGYRTGKPAHIPLELWLNETIVFSAGSDPFKLDVAIFDHPIFPACANPKAEHGWMTWDGGERMCQESSICPFAKRMIGLCGIPVQINVQLSEEVTGFLPGEWKQVSELEWGFRDSILPRMIYVAVPLGCKEDWPMISGVANALIGISIGANEHVIRYVTMKDEFLTG